MRKATYDDYKEFGAAIRLLKDVVAKAIVKAPDKRTADKMHRIADKISDISCQADSEIFRKFPDEASTQVFYGTLSKESVDDVGLEVAWRAMHIVETIFGTEKERLNVIRGCDDGKHESD